jgi:hypothetical protein
MKGSSNLSSLLALSLLVFALLACSGGGSGSKDFSFPADKKDYIGDWRGETADGTMELKIGSDGSVNYERKKGSSTKTISGAKITKFEGNDFEVKVLLMSATFKVSKPPYQDGETWKMVVDDVELTRR